MFLSLIVPFYNSEFKSDRLLNTISHLSFNEVEYIFVDDGSTDDTYKKLVSFQTNHPHHNVTVITQENKGPGGARNTGLKLAVGKYVWFVDSDDDITSEAIEFIHSNISNNYDFIDFNAVMTGDRIVNSMDLKEDSYKFSDHNILAILLKNFGRLSSKAFSRRLLIENNIFYPEYCFYEDNPMVFIYPFYIKNFYKSNITGYLQHLEHTSITRGNQSPKSLDRLKTAEYGLKKGLSLTSNITEINLLMKEFTKQYVTSIELFKTIKPSKDWIMSWRILKQYRDIAKDMEIKTSPFSHLKEYNIKNKVYFYFHWLLSYSILTEQTYYFNNLRKEAWRIDKADL